MGAAPSACDAHVAHAISSWQPQSTVDQALSKYRCLIGKTAATETNTATARLAPAAAGQPTAAQSTTGVVNRWGALVAVSLATLMMLLDFMAVAVALPAVRQSLNASFPELEWVLEAFVLTLAALVLTAGHITDIFGRRPVFLGGLVVFAIGSVLGGLAETPYALIGARVVQGIGGSLLFATGSVLLTETFREARGRAAVAVWGTVTGIAIASSPLVGGEIASALGWRWLFWLAVPVSVLALLIGFVAIKEPVGQAGAARQGRTAGLKPTTLPPAPRTSKHRVRARGEGDRRLILDWMGFILLTAALAILVTGLVKSTTAIEGFSKSGVLACFVMTGLLLVAFVAWETVARAPMLDVSMFRRRTFAGSSIAAFGLSTAVLGPVLCLIVYMSFDQGYSEVTIGAHLLLLTGVTLPFLPLTGFLDRYVPVKLLICGGLALVATGLWLMSRLSATGTLPELVPGLIVAGVGLELVNPRLASAAAATVQPALAAVASRTISTLRQIGTVTGVAVFGAIFAAQLNDQILERTAHLPQLVNANPTIASLVIDGHTARAVGSAPPAVRSQIPPIIQTSFAGAVHDVFFVAAFVALASAVLALTTRSSDVPRAGRRQLSTQSLGSQSSGNGAAPARATSPSANGARPQPAAAATPEPAPSTAATLAALGITVAAPDQAGKLTGTEELGQPGELPRRRELAPLAPEAPDTQAPASETLLPKTLAPMALPPEAPAAEAPAIEAPTIEAPAAEAPAAEAFVPDAPVHEPEAAAPMARSIPNSEEVRAWPGWAGWEKPADVSGRDPLPDLLETIGPYGANGTAVPETGPEDEPLTMTLEDEPLAMTLEDEPLAMTPEDEPPTKTAGEEGALTETGPQDEAVTETGLEAAGAPTALTVGARWVRGHVVAVTGEPLAGALVTLVTTDGDEAGHAIAGRDGSFAVGDMSEGTYTLIAAAPHFRPAASVFGLSSEEATVTLNLFGIGSITGRVTTAKDGSPMSVDIQLVGADGDVAAQYRTGKDGRFSLTDLIEGSYELVTQNVGYSTVEVPVVVERAQTRTIDVALVGVGHIYGAVTGPGGGWLPGVEVALTDGTGRVVATTGTDGAGSYRFSGVPEGPYTVCTTAFGGAFSAVEIQAGSTVAADVNLASL